MLKHAIISTLLLIGASSTVFAHGGASKSAEQAKVYFIEPLDGQTVSGEFTVKFGLSGMGVSPAGIERKNTGHHHLLIDGKKLPDMHKPLPATKHIKHFGGGQTETQLMLAPGKHTLQLLLGNHAHVPHDKAVLSKKITIVVK